MLLIVEKENHFTFMPQNLGCAYTFSDSMFSFFKSEHSRLELDFVC